MFSGIIAAVGRVSGAAPTAGGLRLRLDTGGLDLADVGIGDSIAVNGVCLTVVAKAGGGFESDVSRETLSASKGFTVGAAVNLEKALRLSDRLGGHLVTGHVDGVAVVTGIAAAGDSRVLRCEVPPAFARYIARKGSIALDGVSLTVNEAGVSDFAVNLIPHTLASTNLQAVVAGDRINFEVDLLARYVARLGSPGRG